MGDLIEILQVLALLNRSGLVSNSECELIAESMFDRLRSMLNPLAFQILCDMENLVDRSKPGLDFLNEDAKKSLISD